MALCAVVTDVFLVIKFAYLSIVHKSAVFVMVSECLLLSWFLAPPPYSCIVKSQWPGEGMSTTTASDTEVKSPEKIKISEVRPHADRKLPPIPGSPRTGSLRGGWSSVGWPFHVNVWMATDKSGRIHGESGNV